MAFSEYQKERIENILKEKRVDFYGKKMFGGYCFMVDDKMCLGLRYNKKVDKEELMARIGATATDANKDRLGCREMDFTGRPFKDYVFVDGEGYDLDEDLEHWVQLALDFNPLAKKSAKRRKKT